MLLKHFFENKPGWDSAKDIYCVVTFQERLEAAGGENQSVAVVATIDDDGAPAEPESVVACPLCKLVLFSGKIYLSSLTTISFFYRGYSNNSWVKCGS